MYCLLTEHHISVRPLEELPTFPEPEVVRKPQYPQTLTEPQGVSASPETLKAQQTPQEKPEALKPAGMCC